MPSDGGASWADYIPWHLSRGFTTYALRLAYVLPQVFGLGLPLQTAFPLHSPLVVHDLLDGFVMDDPHTATHLSRRMRVNLVNTLTVHIP